MKYDRDLIATMYILQQSDVSLAERMWNRLVVEQEKNKSSLFVSFGLTVTSDVIEYIKRNHSSSNKIAAIKAMREQTGWGLKDAKDAIDLMIAKNILH